MVPTVAYVSNRPVGSSPFWILVAQALRCCFVAGARTDVVLWFRRIALTGALRFCERRTLVLVVSLGGGIGWLTFFEIGKAISYEGNHLIFRSVGLVAACCWRCLPRAASARCTGPNAPAVLFIGTWVIKLLISSRPLCW